MSNQIARTAKQIGAAIRRRRKALRLTQDALGERAKLRQATISDLEAGEPGIQLRTLLDVLAALDLELLIRTRTKASARDIEAAF
jgi:HTH-type transcriptional regulator/antitoxin HipB